ncbi:hypothetical protein FVE85_3182 [Porphyridium purpureum]|uniref:Nucleotide-diphospho-sugar transferase domain-containing protein n=1 Tax=Porphyridium purpureum TaxID=35688 RepID=A0A5J4YTV1_PORPP|nr:hypothetical protein FVE85_3182 [Porphyridium purpureum]|eukprot:POR7705..scf227_4
MNASRVLRLCSLLGILTALLLAVETLMMQYVKLPHEASDARGASASARRADAFVGREPAAGRQAERNGRSSTPRDDASYRAERLISYMDAQEWDDVLAVPDLDGGANAEGSSGTDGSDGAGPDDLVLFFVNPTSFLKNLNANAYAGDQAAPNTAQSVEWVENRISELECELTSSAMSSPKPKVVVVVNDLVSKGALVLANFRSRAMPVLRASSVLMQVASDMQMELEELDHALVPLMTRTFLSLGYNVLSVDHDVYFLQNPFPLHQLHHSIVLQFDQQGAKDQILQDNGLLPDTGMIYFEFDMHSLTALEGWIEECLRRDSSNDSPSMHLAKGLLDVPPESLTSWDTSHFAYGMCAVPEDLARLQPRVLRIECNDRDREDAVRSELQSRRVALHDPVADKCIS